jgi:U32 family peptidase
MKMKRNEIELMAPVGSYETLMAAIQGKANAVYFGVGKLNMRSKSTHNFTETDLENIVKICHENKIKAYVTVNTVMYDDDLLEMKETLNNCKKFKVDAIIASDLAVINFAKTIGIEVHISTQQNVSNTEALRFFSQFSEVVVLARELNLKQVKSIYDAILNENILGPSGKPIKLEMFAHGALCMAISGKCYLSLHNYNHSANRGECLQLCRRAYEVTDKETQTKLEIDNEYIMSPKDLCTIEFIDKLIDSGIRVLKIEGRARSAEYVKTVTECYDAAIQSYCDHEYTKEKIETWLKKLSTVYNRGFWDGYYLGKKLGEWSSIYGSKATKKKVYLGKCTNYFSRLKVAEFIVETEFISVDDEIIIVGPSTGVIETTIKEIRVNLDSVQSAKKGDTFSFPIENLVRRSDKLYKLIPSNTLE